jgi:manganese/iron transport system substrate-binding protein
MKTVSAFSQTFSWLLTAGILIGVYLGSCQPNNNLGQNNDKPRVVSTSTIIADLTTQVGGDEIEHEGILQPGSDPHVYEPTPKDSIALEKAELILYNGYNLEPGLIKMMNATGQAEKFAVGEVVKPLDYEYKGQKC